MIVSEIFYGVKCDRCGEVYEDGEHSFWTEEDSAIENAIESEWAQLKGKHYCTGCHEVNEDTDEVIPYEEFPKYLKTLNSFLDRIAQGTSRQVQEPDGTNQFIVKGRFYNKAKFADFEENYIKSLIGEYFISLEYEEGKYNSRSYTIVIKKTAS